MQKLSDRQKKLLWHAWHRGMQELDLLIGRTVEKYIETMDDTQLDLLEHFLQADDADVWHWITEKKPIPEEYDTIIWSWILKERGTL